MILGCGLSSLAFPVSEERTQGNASSSKGPVAALLSVASPVLLLAPLTPPWVAPLTPPLSVPTSPHLRLTPPPALLLLLLLLLVVVAVAVVLVPPLLSPPHLRSAPRPLLLPCPLSPPPRRWPVPPPLCAATRARHSR